MAYFKSNDPGSINRWKRSVSDGLRRAQRVCPACHRASLGGTFRFPEERLTVWRCRFCAHEKATHW